VRVLNAGVNGDTVAQGLKRLPAVLRRKPTCWWWRSGSTTACGTAAEVTEVGLRQILALAQGARVRVLLAGLRIPARHGEEHAAASARSTRVWRRIPRSSRARLLAAWPDSSPQLWRRPAPDGGRPEGLGREVRPPLELLLAEVERPAADAPFSRAITEETGTFIRIPTPSSMSERFPRCGKRKPVHNARGQGPFQRPWPWHRSCQRRACAI